MTKQEAINYIKQHAYPFQLEYEVLRTFEAFCKSAALRDEEVNYYQEANDALYEWDI